MIMTYGTHITFEVGSGDYFPDDCILPWIAVFADIYYTNCLQ